MITIDFETHPIVQGARLSPAPIGVAIKYNDAPARYIGFGHQGEESPEAFETARLELETIWASGEALLCHNAAFDLAVARDHFGLPVPNHTRIHDTMILLYLDDPQSSTLSLKPSAERILGLPPDEQDAVKQYLVDNRIVAKSSKSWGAHIHQVPESIVAPYAIGDVDRTYALWMVLMPQITEAKMLDAYVRETKLLPILMQNRLDGVRCDVAALRRDLVIYMDAYRRINADLRDELGGDMVLELNLDSGQQVAERLRAMGKTIGEADWPLTASGQLKTDKATMLQVITCPGLQSKLHYRSSLKTCLSTFLSPWCVLSAEDGRLHPDWQQVRGDKYGTRTGRISCAAPNLTNIPNPFESPPPEGYPPLPVMRRYILPDEEEVFVSADFASQEIRILGHFAEGEIARIYNQDPNADVHQVTADLIKEQFGIKATRKAVKMTSFGILYGAGSSVSAKGIGCTLDEAKSLRDAYFGALSGVRDLIYEVQGRARRNKPVRSWGGRLLHAPKPVVNPDGTIVRKDYVLINYLIQGSAADQCKEALIEYDRIRQHGRFLVTVYDEICISVPMQYLYSEVELLKRAMESGNFDVPMRTSVEHGPNWADLRPIQ